MQSNKVKKALNFFDVIHTLDRESLALEISKHLTSKSKTKSFMIQVNTGDEKNKSGISLDDFEDFNSLTISGKQKYPLFKSSFITDVFPVPGPPVIKILVDINLKNYIKIKL